MRIERVYKFVIGRKKGFSIIEVITAVAILGIGIWAIVALFPTGQNIIRRSGLRQLAIQLAHESITDYLANPEKLPFAIVPFNPTDPQINNRPVLLEPTDLLTVRRTFNFVWGEPLELVRGNNGWRAILRFAPIMDRNGDGQVNDIDVRIYREIRYRFSATDRNGNGDPRDDLQDFEFYFDPTQPNALYLAAGIVRPTGWRVLRVTYLPQGSLIPIVRELYLNNGTSPETLRLPSSAILEVVEEFPILPYDGNDQDGDGNPLDVHEFRFVYPSVLEFNTSTPRPLGFNALDARLKGLFADYLIDDSLNGGGHWLIETGTTFDPDPALRQKLGVPPNAVVSVFQTTIGGILVDNSVIPPVPIAQFFNLMPPPNWGSVVSPAPVGLGGSDPQGGLFLFPNLSSGTRLRIAYRVEGDWFLQVVKPPNDFQLFPANVDQQVLSNFPYEQLRWFTQNGNTFQFNVLLAGMSVQVKYRDGAGLVFSEVKSIGSNGIVNLSQIPNVVESVSGSSLLVRVSGQSMWRQAPPRTKADYVELVTIIPTPARVTQP
ncbi:MAG: type IV pilus modification PilV family protein [Candidatus Fervidibacter sp.]|uniref:type IV pilus modification PilV family protein n=1 Tax=Candidatus Fervidibacter sp. TaxID=3100871 RepID=UPI0040496F9D